MAPHPLPPPTPSTSTQHKSNSPSHNHHHNSHGHHNSHHSSASTSTHPPSSTSSSSHNRSFYTQAFLQPITLQIHLNYRNSFQEGQRPFKVETGNRYGRNHNSIHHHSAGKLGPRHTRKSSKQAKIGQILKLFSSCLDVHLPVDCEQMLREDQERYEYNAENFGGDNSLRLSQLPSVFLSNIAQSYDEDANGDRGTRVTNGVHIPYTRSSQNAQAAPHNTRQQSKQQNARDNKFSRKITLEELNSIEVTEEDLNSLPMHELDNIFDIVMDYDLISFSLRRMHTLLDADQKLPERERFTPTFRKQFFAEYQALSTNLFCLLDALVLFKLRYKQERFSSTVSLINLRPRQPKFVVKDKAPCICLVSFNKLSVSRSHFFHFLRQWQTSSNITNLTLTCCKYTFCVKFSAPS